MKYVRWCDLKLLRIDPFLTTNRYIISISLIQTSLSLMTPFNNRLFFNDTLTTKIISEYQFIMQTHGLVSRPYRPARMLVYQEKRV